MKPLQKNILTVEHGIILHQVNCYGKFNKGLAKSIREKFPKVYLEYLEYVQNKTPEELLGTYNDVRINDLLIVVNCFSQKNYGNDGKLYTNYIAMETIFRNVYREYCLDRYPFYIPYGYGCGYGGGDWNKVSEIIEKTIPEAIICKL